MPLAVIGTKPTMTAINQGHLPKINNTMKQTLTFLYCMCTWLATGQTTYQLIGTGNWDDPSVWTPNGLPGATDTVVIDGAFNGATLTVTLTADVSVARLTYTGFWEKHTINGSGNITLGTNSEWRGGTLAGDVTLTVPSGVTLNLSKDSNGSNLKNMTGNAALVNNGTMVWTGTSIWLQENASLTNNGDFSCTVSETISIYGNGNLGSCILPTSSFTNAGTFSFNGSGNLLSSTAWVTNSGTFNISSGYLELTQNTTENSGSMNFNASDPYVNRLFNYESTGGTLHFGGSTTVEINTKCRRSILGNVTGSDGTLKIAPSSLTDTTILDVAIPAGISLDFSSSGLLRLDVSQDVNNSMTLDKDVIGTGTLVVKAPNTLTWTDGYFNHGVDLTVEANAFLELPSGDNRSINNGSVLSNYGTMTFIAGNFGLDNGTFNNYGLLTFANNNLNLTISNNGSSDFHNYGTVEMTSASGYCVIVPRVTNHQSGFLTISSQFLEFRAFNITNDGTLNGNGIYQFPQPSNYPGTADQTIHGTIAPGITGIGEISLWLPTNIYLTGTLAIQTDGSQCDKLKSDGNTFHIQPGATLQVSEISPLTINSHCVILQTEKNFNGTFSTENLPVGYSLLYNDKEIWLVNGVLPVELIRFHGNSSILGNSLRWTTASEADAAGFDVERSTDGQAWRPLGTLPAAGNSSTEQEYHFLDNNPPAACYYRLRMVDLDGSYRFSDVVFLRQEPSTDTELTVFPNPVGKDGQVSVQTDMPAGKLVVRDYSGRILLEEQFEGSAPSAPVTIPLDLRHLPSGVYLLQHVDGAAVRSARVVK
jgi:hypothetical protein